MTDLFEKIEGLPMNIRTIIEKYDCDDNYENCEMLIDELETHGYTCDYDLSGAPYGLKKIVGGGY